MTPATIATTALAWIGGALSIVLGILKVIEFRRDRACVVVSYKTGWRVTPGSAYDPTKDYLVVTVANRGRRPITITNVAGEAKRRGGKGFVLSDSVLYGNRELAEGKAATYLCEQQGLDLSMMRGFIAFDMTGRRYRCRIRKQDRCAPKTESGEPDCPGPGTPESSLRLWHSHPTHRPPGVLSSPSQLFPSPS